MSRLRPFALLLIVCVLASRSSAAAPASYLDELIQSAHRQKLAEQRPWLLLLHYHHQLLGLYRSDIDDPTFFLSPRGKKDPSAELDATLTAFFQSAPSDPEQQAAACRYPARYAWLKEQLHFDSRLPPSGGVPLPLSKGSGLPDLACPRFEKWRDQMDATSVTMVFASYYMNNPASMYGHTFLRLNRAGENGNRPLIDYVVNFAAYPGSYNGILYTVEGLTGGYPGRFSTMPYYMKVQEYNNLESRDLWEYTLNLDSASVDRLLQHLWELGPHYMDYYFLNKNCSYQLLPPLEVADPALHMTEAFHFKAIPMDTLRAVIHQPGMVSSITVRPSHVNQMLAARAALSKKEVRLAEQLAQHADQGVAELKQLPVDRQVKVLDSAYNLFRYRTGFVREQKPEVQEQERALLLMRNQLSQGADTVAASTATPATVISPDQGHQTGRVGVGFGWTKHSHFEELSLRPAVQDLNDDSLGYIPGSQLQMFHLRLRYDNDRKTLYTQEFTLVDLVSLSPWDPWVRHLSYSVGTGLAVANDLDKDPENSLYYGLHAGSGLSYETHLLRKELFYALAVADGGVGHVFDDSYRLGGGTNSGVVVDATKFWRINFNASYIQYPLGNTGSVTKLQLIQSVPVGKENQFRVTVQRQNAYKEILLSFLHYL